MTSVRWLLVTAVAATLNLVPMVHGDTADLEQQVQQMRAALQEQNARIQQLEAQVARQSQEATVAQVLERLGSAQEKAAATVNLGKGTDSLTLKGDLRLRYEHLENHVKSADDTRTERFRTRFRLGLEWQGADGWRVGAGLATGAVADGRSTNQTWSTGGPFTKSPISLDLAYAAHQWDLDGAQLALTLGQQKNPFRGNPVFFDSDLRPAGVTVGGTLAPVFATVGVYDVWYQGMDQDHVFMTAAQVGADLPITERAKACLALGWQHLNSAVQDTLAAAPDAAFNVGTVYADVSATLDPVKVKAFGEYARNFSATGGAGEGQLGDADLDADDEDQAFALGAEAGALGFTLGYVYAEVEENALYSGFTDTDFGAGLRATDFQSHQVYLKYAVTRNLELGLTTFFAKPLHDTTQVGETSSGASYRLDAIYSF